MGKLCNSFGQNFAPKQQTSELRASAFRAAATETDMKERYGNSWPSQQRLILLLTTPQKGFAPHGERYLVEKMCTCFEESLNNEQE